MARHFPTGIDLHAAAILNALLNPLSSDPGSLGSGDEARLWYNSTAKTVKFWNGTAVIDLLARANQSGTQLAATISDFNTAVRTNTLNQMVAPTADLSINTHKLTNVVDGTGAQDAATKGQLDAAVAALQSGLVLKGAVKCASTTNVNLASPGTTVDGITMSNGDLFLAGAQTTGSQSGPYVYNGSGTPATRATNWNTTAQAVLGSFWIVEQGTNADTLAVMTNDTAITLGTDTPLFIYRGSAGATYTAGNGLGLTGTQFNIIPGSGLLADGTSARVDYSKVLQKVQGVIPTTTTGIVSVSGANITINHGLNNSAVDCVIRAFSSPYSGYSAGQKVEFDDVCSDANNVTLALPAAPASNNWTYMIWG